MVKPSRVLNCIYIILVLYICTGKRNYKLNREYFKKSLHLVLRIDNITTSKRETFLTTTFKREYKMTNSTVSFNLNVVSNELAIAMKREGLISTEQLLGKVRTDANILSELVKDDVSIINALSTEEVQSLVGKRFSINEMLKHDTLYLETKVGVLRKLASTNTFTFYTNMLFEGVIAAWETGFERTSNRAELVQQLTEKWETIFFMFKTFNIDTTKVEQTIRQVLLSDIEYINKTTKGNGSYTYFLGDIVPEFCEPQIEDVDGSDRAWENRVIAFHTATNWKFYDGEKYASRWFIREAAVFAGFLTRAQVVLDRSMKIRKVAAAKHGVQY